MIVRILKPSKSHSFFLFGPRGVGKSTLIKELFEKENVLWVDLLDQKIELELTQDPDLLLRKWAIKKPKWIVIDEVQKIPRLLDVAHRGIEEHKIRFVLTGSSARKLKRGGANLLAGRAASYSLSSFSALELGESFNQSQALEFGMLPLLWTDLHDAPSRARSLYSYVHSYLKEEVAAEQLVRDLDPFRRFLSAAAQSNGKIINFASLERDAGIRHSQAERHFEILADTLIGRFLEPYHTSIRQRQTKKSKFYFFDTGVVRALKNLAGESLLPSTYEYGDLFETFLINEFFHLSDALEKRWKLSYLRTKDDAEIDLIIEKPRGKPILIEIKSWHRFPAHEALSSYTKISDAFPGSQKYLFSNVKEPRQIGKISCVHWLDGLREIFELR